MDMPARIGQCGHAQEGENMVFQDKNVKPGKRILLIDPEKIKSNPNQPRQIFDPNEMLGLAESIRKNGILQPLSVRRKDDGELELIAGERRLRAALMLGLPEVPCIEVPADERRSAVLALLENLQRQDLNCFEEAEGIVRLIEEWEITQEEAAMRLGKAQSTLANKLRLLRITPSQRKRILESGLTERHARALLRIEDDDERGKALEYVAEKGLNVAQTDLMVENILNPVRRLNQSHTMLIKDVRIFQNTVSKAIETMRRSGIDANSRRCETDDYIEYVIRIPRSADERVLSRN